MVVRDAPDGQLLYIFKLLTNFGGYFNYCIQILPALRDNPPKFRTTSLSCSLSQFPPQMTPFPSSLPLVSCPNTTYSIRAASTPRAAFAGSYSSSSLPFFIHAPSPNNCIIPWICSGMLTGTKAISEVVAAIAILNQNTLVSLPVPRPLPTSLLLVFVYRPQVQANL